jgi:DNA-binding LacI/PurR family transcriptional regulator
MRDVAVRAGVSVQTVSNLVNERFHLMTDKTRARVAQAMDELGYHPNVAARTLRSARTGTLAFLIVDEGARFLADPMTDLVVAGIGDVARDRDYALLIRAARPGPRSSALFEPLLGNRADAAFLFLSGPRELRAWYIERVAALGFDFVAFDHSTAPAVNAVGADDREGARALVTHLIERGHERLAFTASAAPWPMVELRHAGYLDALAKAGIVRDPALEAFAGVWSAASGAAVAGALLDLPNRPTAIVAGNDLLALGAIRAASERGLRVPEDVAVAGFDDFDFAEFVRPPLTTVRIPGYELGRAAATGLIDQLEGRRAPGWRVTLPVELCLRESA